MGRDWSTWLANKAGRVHVAVFWGTWWKMSLGDRCIVRLRAHAGARGSEFLTVGVCDLCGPRDLGR